MHVGVLEQADGDLVVTPTIEWLVAEGTVFDTTRKYDGSTGARMPAEVPVRTRESIGDAALLLFRALGCAGYARFDFFVTGGGIVLNEVNTSPGMTDRSGFPLMCAAMGLDHASMVDHLVAVALARASTRSSGSYLSTRRERAE